MTTAYQHRPLSNILANTAGTGDDEASTEEQPRNEKGQFAAAETPEEDTNLPEKYRGKTQAEIAEMHMNAEKRLGSLQNEVGQLRGLVKDLADVQRQPQPTTEKAEDLDLSDADFLNDPVGSTKKIAEHVHASTKEDAPRKSVDDVELEAETAALLSDFPDMNNLVSDPAFQEYCNSRPSRIRDAQIAATGTNVEAVYAARRLLEGYDDLRQAAPTAQSKPEESPAEAAKAVSNEGGRGKAPVPKDLIYEQDVIQLIQNEPDKYRSPSFQKELQAAIREGRFVKQG